MSNDNAYFAVTFVSNESRFNYRAVAYVGI